MIRQGVSDEMRKDLFRSLINSALIAAAPSSLSVIYSAYINSWWTDSCASKIQKCSSAEDHRLNTHPCRNGLLILRGLYINKGVSGDVYSIVKEPMLLLKGPDHRAQCTQSILDFTSCHSHHKHSIWHWRTKEDGFEKCVRMAFFVNMHWVQEFDMTLVSHFSFVQCFMDNSSLKRRIFLFLKDNTNLKPLFLMLQLKSCWYILPTF